MRIAGGLAPNEAICMRVLAEYWVVWIKVKPVQCGTLYGCFSRGTSIYISTSKKHLVFKVFQSVDFPIG